MVKAKKLESLRQKSGNKTIVRLIHTLGGLIDKRWTSDLGLNENNLPEYILVRYPEDIDKYLPITKDNCPYWDKECYDELNVFCPAPLKIEDQNKQKPEKFIKARELFKAEGKFFLTFNDFKEAQDKYIEWCDTYCKVKISKMESGKDYGDD
ncbi:MAG: hypothetical protein AABY22_17075 [Nanoarchaeota archaeon]